jgi:hypothetical protein
MCGAGCAEAIDVKQYKCSDRRGAVLLLCKKRALGESSLLRKAHCRKPASAKSLLLRKVCFCQKCAFLNSCSSAFQETCCCMPKRRFSIDPYKLKALMSRQMLYTCGGVGAAPSRLIACRWTARRNAVKSGDERPTQDQPFAKAIFSRAKQQLSAGELVKGWPFARVSPGRAYRKCLVNHGLCTGSGPVLLFSSCTAAMQ